MFSRVEYVPDRPTRAQHDYARRRGQRFWMIQRAVPAGDVHSEQSRKAGESFRRRCSKQFAPHDTGAVLESATTPLKPKEGLNGPLIFLGCGGGSSVPQLTAGLHTELEQC
jgi:hypothetical protein